MVQGRENLSAIAGTIVDRSPHPTLPDWELISLTIDDAQPVPGQADLLSSRRGSTVEVAVRRDLLAGAGAGVGARLRCRAKLVADGAMCEPWPAPEDFSISPAG